MFILTPNIKAAIAAAAAFEAFAPQPCIRMGTVEPSDATCDIFSARNHVSTFQLQYVNKGLSCRFLVPGMQLCLGREGSDCTDTHVVRFGEFCIEIAALHGIGLDTLFHNNPNVNPSCDNIYPGEVLCVGKTEYNYGPNLD